MSPLPLIRGNLPGILEGGAHPGLSFEHTPLFSDNPGFKRYCSGHSYGGSGRMRRNREPGQEGYRGSGIVQNIKKSGGMVPGQMFGIGRLAQVRPVVPVTPRTARHPVFLQELVFWPVSPIGTDNPELLVYFFDLACNARRKVRAALFGDQEPCSADYEICDKDIDEPAIGST